MDIKDLLKNASDNILTEDTLSSIQTLFNEAVDAKANTTVEKRLKLEEVNIRKAINTKHGREFKRVVEMIDNDHASKMEQLVEGVAKESLNKLKKVKSFYESKLLKEQASAKKAIQELSKNVSVYLEEYLEKAIPTALIKESAKNEYTQTLLEKIQKISGASKVFGDKQVTKVIEESQNRASMLEREVKKLKQEKAKKEARFVLENKTKNMPREMADYVKSRLFKKSPTFITENIDYVVSMYKRDQKNVAKREKQQVISESRRQSNVDHQGAGGEKTINESVQKTNPLMDVYMQGLKNTSGKGQ